MTVSDELSSLYGPYYFRTYNTAPYERSQVWLLAFGTIADAIVRDIAPRTVLDAGCSMGLLVESLRDRGVEAWGLDVSTHAIEQVREDVRGYCRVASLAAPLTERYDLIVCNEVIEHLPAADAERAIANLCSASDDVLFSSTPDGYAEDTHLNVRPVEYWTELFAKHGFARDVDYDCSTFLAPWARRFRKTHDPWHRTAASYERRLWATSREVAELRRRGLETAAVMARQDAALRERADLQRLEQTVAEQQEHLDALNERLQYMSDHESELRRMLLDAHQQILERDLMLQGHPNAGLSGSTQAALQTLVDERTAWAQNAVAELERCRKVALERQHLIEERTAWAQRAVAELESYRQAKHPRLLRVWRAVRGAR